jgi:hypothetical protein
VRQRFQMTANGIGAPQPSLARSATPAEPNSNAKTNRSGPLILNPRLASAPRGTPAA